MRATSEVGRGEQRAMTWRPAPSAPGGLQLLPATAPPAAGEPLGTWRVDSTAQLRALRAGLQKALPPHRTTSGPVVLVASELATNALRHGEPPADVTLSRGDGLYLLDVADGAVGAVPALAARRPLGQGGYGLYLVGLLAQDVGWYVADGRKHVWAAFGR